MKTIIAGGRNITNYNVTVSAIHDSGWTDEITEVVCGGAQGVDRNGSWWAEQRRIPVKDFPADWVKHGKPAGPIRNEQMAKYADALILIWDGQSRGSANMLMWAEHYGLKVYQHIVKVSP